LFALSGKRIKAMDTSILYIILAAIFGIILGKLDTLFTNKLKKGREEKKEQALQAQLEQRDAKIEELKAKLAAPRPQPPQESALRLAPDLSGGWLVEIDGQPARPESITVEQRTRLIALLGHIRPLVEAKPVAGPASSVPSAPLPPASAPQPAAAPASPALTRPVAQAPSGSTLPPDPLRANLVSGFRSMMEPKAKSEPASGLVSLVALIDNVLQKKLAGTPLASRQIHLEEGRLGEVIVNVGASRYPGIDSVPDPAIQAIIREAIEEFNRGQ
jgi:hypothetical protein